MIVCRKCGYQNDDADGFCGSCGSFLEWTGEKVKPKIPEEFVAAAQEEAQQQSRQQGFLKRTFDSAASFITPMNMPQKNDAAAASPRGAGRPASCGNGRGVSLPGQGAKGSAGKARSCSRASMSRMRAGATYFSRPG